MENKLTGILFKPRKPPPFRENQWWTFLACLRNTELYLPQLPIEILNLIYSKYSLLSFYSITRSCPDPNCNFKIETCDNFCKLAHENWLKIHIENYHKIQFSKFQNMFYSECGHKPNYANSGKDQSYMKESDGHCFALMVKAIICVRCGRVISESESWQ